MFAIEPINGSKILVALADEENISYCFRDFVPFADDAWWPILGSKRTFDDEPKTFKAHPSQQYVIPVSRTAVNTAVCGITVYRDYVYVIRESSNILEVYAANDLNMQKRTKITIPPKYHEEREYYEPHPSDIASSDRQKCIYICDAMNSCILRLEPLDNGEANCKPWRVPGLPRGLSVNSNGFLIVSCFKDSVLCEYSPDGILQRQVILDERTICPYHAVQIANDEWLVSYQTNVSEPDEKFGVCTVDQYGEIFDTFGESSSGDDGVADQLNAPLHLALDVNGWAIVADCNNNRIKLLSPNLESVRDVLNKSDLLNPAAIYIHAVSRRLFVGLKDGRVIVYSIGIGSRD